MLEPIPVEGKLSGRRHSHDTRFRRFSPPAGKRFTGFEIASVLELAPMKLLGSERARLLGCLPTLEPLG